MIEFSVFELYKSCFYIRTVESILAENYSKGNIRTPMHLSVGQELVPGMISQLSTPADLAVSSHRSHGHYLGKGGCLSSFYDELHGLPSGCSSGRGGSMHLIDTSIGFMGSTAIVGNTIPIGVGLAQSLKLRNSPNVVFIFLGDAATEEGVFYESLHYASLYSLPVVFVVENNQFSVYTNLEIRQANIPLSKKISGFNVSYSYNDNHDYLLLYQQFNDAIKRCRNGSGPACLEIMTFRYLEHCGPSEDDNLNYRESSYINKWKSLDIIDLLKSDLIDSEICSSSSLHLLESEILQSCLSEFNDSQLRRHHYSIS